MIIDSSTAIQLMKSVEAEKDLEPPDLCRACALTSLDSKSLLDLSTETKQRLDFCGQIDLEEYCLDRVMDNLGSDNANEIARQIQEIGTSFTSSIEKCQQHLLSALGEAQMDSQIVARIISMMIVTTTQRNDATPATSFAIQNPSQSGNTNSNWDTFGSTSNAGGTAASSASGASAAPKTDAAPLPWDGLVFVSAVRAMSPSLNWHDVVSHLDHPYFNLRSKAALELLTQILLEGMEGHAFPIGFLYRTWNGNKAGQLSWLVQIVQNPDVFFVLDYPHRPVNCSCLKVVPDDSSRSVAQWKCLDLVEALFRLSEVSTLTTSVYNLLRAPGPIASCPDLLFLGVVQISIAMGQLRVHTLKQLVGQLLSGHANAVSVLSFAWNFDNNRQALRQIVLNAMATYYSQNSEDQSRLTRILGIAHELKPNGLAELFNLPQFLFVIDLACLASRRDFLKLDKFLDDKMTEHGDNFAQHLCYYIKRRCPGIATNPIPSETFQCIYTALQARSNFSSLVANELSQLVSTIRNAQAKMNENRLNSGARTPLNLPPVQPSSQQQLSGAAGTLGSPSTAPAIGTAFGGGPGSGSAYNLGGGSFSPATVSKPLGVDAARLGVRTPLNLPQQTAGIGGNAGGGAAPFGNGPFSFFHSRDQQQMRNRPNSGMGNPLDFRPQFSHFAPMGGLMHGVSGINPSAPGAGSGGTSAPTAGMRSEFTESLENATFSDEVQEEANSYFQQIYSPAGRMSVYDFITKLKLFRDSINQKEKELLMCVVKNLFDEYRFFQDYPERELKTTAEVYGGLIREGIISNLHFATAVRKVVEALQSDPNKPLFTFGIVALNACRAVLFKYPKVCQMILNIESFVRFPSPLKDYVTSGAHGALPNSQATHRETPSWNLQLQQQQGSGSGLGGLISANNGGASSVQNSSIGVSSAPSPAVNVSNMKFAPRGLTSGGASILNVTNVDTLINAAEREGTVVKQPPSAIYEKVSFLCNNLSQTNLMRKTEEMKEIIAEAGDDFLQWLAQYLVMKRVTVEQNFQPLYNNFLLSINEEGLDDYVQKETFRNVDILLRSDKRQAVSNFGDRQLLKNLGHWLGVITIGRDKPILSKDLDLKFLLLEAFYKGQQELLYVVPFVVKTLSASAKSTVFGPRCAWIYGILKVLVEIHNEPDLKLNLKFEIEVLCKDLNVDLRSVEVSNYLKESSRLPKLVPVKQDGPSPVPTQVLRLGNTLLGPADENSIMPGAPSGGFGAASASAVVHSMGVTVKSEASSVAAADESSLAVSKGQASAKQQPSDGKPPILHVGGQAAAVFHYNDINIYSQEGLSQHLKDPSHLTLFQQYPALKVLCKTAIVHAIKELIGGITDRSINVAITATEHVCRKDFAMDPDEMHIRRAAHQMMRAMTAGMAAITCREPLASTILGYLKQALYNHLGHSSTANAEQSKMVEEAAFAVTEANLEVATNFIVKSACEKAVSELEKRMDVEFSTRRAMRKENRAFIPLDPEVVAMTEKVPEQIRVKRGLLNDAQLKVYNDYSAKICGFKPMSPEEMFMEFARRGPMTPINNVAMNANNISGAGGMLAKMAMPTGNGGFSMYCQPQDGTGAPLATPENVGGGLVTSSAAGAGITQSFGDCATGGGMPPVQLMNDDGTHKSDDDQALQVKVESILREWLTLCYLPATQRDPQQALACIVKMMHQNGVLSTDEMISKFFKLCADICFDVSYRLLKNDNGGQSTVVRQRCYYTLDAFVKLTCLMVKYSDGTHHTTKVNLLKKVLGILTTALHTDHEARKPDFNGMPFHRILILMFNELTASDPVLEPIMWNILESFGQALFVLQPRRVPGFAFHWLDIIGHRNFIGRLLSESFDPVRTGAMYTQLILCHLKFLTPFLRNVQLPKPIAFIYKGTLRVLLVILHDFPEILCEYHYVLCDVIPANCVQLRNLVLSAYPRDMRLPDPFTQSMEMIESLPEMSINPKMHREMSAIIPTDLRARLDDYLETRSSVSFLSDLPGLLQVSQVAGSKYNVSVMNAVVMYVGVRAIDSIHERMERISMATIAHTAFMDIFQNLAVSLCTEGRYLLFNAIANQLRYPNSHTHYFSCTLLYLFLEANAEIIQEQITRILFERLVALRPHPWGLLITFIELIRNRRYDFWHHDFVRCAPEIERLFTSVASSCSVQQSLADPQQQQQAHVQQPQPAAAGGGGGRASATM